MHRITALIAGVPVSDLDAVTGLDGNAIAFAEPPS
jgi:hypothetical protein